MGGRQEAGKENWLLIKEKDEEARSGKKSDVTQSLPASVATGKSIEQIATGKHAVWQSNRPQLNGPSVPRLGVPFRVLPLRCRQSRPRQMGCPAIGDVGHRLSEGEEWVHELKYDGYRILCRIKAAGPHC